MSKANIDHDNPHFCILPWIHLYVTPWNDVFPCCNSMQGGTAGSLLDEDLVEIFNGEGMRSLRRRMLEGRASPQCRRCYEAEAAGFESMRQHVNHRFSHRFDRCANTAEDGRVDDGTLTYLDLRFSNICNFRCRFCWHRCSSSWHDEYAQLHPGYRQPKLLKAGRHEDHLWDQVAGHLATVDEIYFAGGEPLLMREHYLILEELDRLARHDVRLAYTTNLSVLTYKDQRVTDYWRRFSHVRVGLSLDGLGRRGEYIRKGLDWAGFLRNLAEIRERCPQVELSFTFTINMLNIFDLIAIFDHGKRQALFDGIPIRINLLDQPASYSIQVLPMSIKEELRKEFLAYAEVTDGRFADENRTSLESVIAFMEAEDHSHLLADFFERTDRLDQLRQESLDEIMPELGRLRSFVESEAQRQGTGCEKGLQPTG